MILLLGTIQLPARQFAIKNIDARASLESIASENCNLRSDTQNTYQRSNNFTAKELPTLNFSTVERIWLVSSLDTQVSFHLTM